MTVNTAPRRLPRTRVGLDASVRQPPIWITGSPTVWKLVARS